MTLRDAPTRRRVKRMHSWQTYFRDGRDVFRRHWKLLVLPIPLALLITIWVVASTPTMYQSQAAIWSNSTAAQAAAINATEPTPLTPAAVQQSLLNELLSTNVFRTSVATTSPLGAWLAAHPQSTLTPSGLAGLLHGSPPMSERIKTALLSGTSTAVQGPQVLSVSFQAQSPTLARETLSALLTNFAAQRSALLPAGTFQVLDSPSTPAGPTSGASKSLTTILVGLLAGAIVTLLAVTVLTLLGDRARGRAAAPQSAALADARPITPDPMPAQDTAVPHAVAASAQARRSADPDPRALRPRGSQP